MIPDEIISAVETELSELSFGRVCLEIIRHDSHSKYRVIKEISFVPGKETSGSGGSHA